MYALHAPTVSVCITKVALNNRHAAQGLCNLATTVLHVSCIDCGLHNYGGSTETMHINLALALAINLMIYK